jgi:type II secretory ATPase GspE/PulE/Tfp pilus assembly ATPase PilB-like protein
MNDRILDAGDGRYKGRRHLYLYHPAGCDECGQTGYRGKTCVAEIFTFTPQIKRMLRRKENIGSIYQTALDEGMNTLIREALAKVLAGHTDYRHARLSCLQQSY